MNKQENKYEKFEIRCIACGCNEPEVLPVLEVYDYGNRVSITASCPECGAFGIATALKMPTREMNDELQKIDWLHVSD